MLAILLTVHMLHPLLFKQHSFSLSATYTSLELYRNVGIGFTQQEPACMYEC